MWKMGCRPPLGKGQRHFKCIECKVQTTSNMFLELTKVAMFLFVFTVPLNMAEAYFPLYWHLCGKWAVGPLVKGQRHSKCIECNVQTTSNIFLELTKVGMFLFVFTVPLNMAEAYFLLFWHLCGKWAVGPPLGRVRGILNALNAKFRQQATCFLSSLRWACFYLSSLCP